MSRVTRILAQIDDGDPAAEQLLPLVYDELRRLAAARLKHEKPGQTLQATALVHEAYVRLVQAAEGEHWDSRGHFFAAAAEAMRRILIDRARRKQRPKHGGDRSRIDIESVFPADEADPAILVAMDEALCKLEAEHPEKSTLIKLRYYGGLSMHDAAEALGVSYSTAKRYWSFSRAFLYEELTNSH